MIPALAATALGAATWSLAEHVIHENLGHKYAKRRGPLSGNAFSREHVRHHATTSYFAATGKKVAVAAATTAAVAPVAVAVAGATVGAAFTLGFVGTYVSYEIIHRIAHTRAPRTRYGRWFRKHHFHHHFHNPSVNHGVTSPIWDHLFGTYEEPGKIRVPKKHAMPWLVDPGTDEARAEFADDYEIVHKRQRASGVTGAQPSAAKSPMTAPVPGRSRSPNARSRSNLARNSL